MSNDDTTNGSQQNPPTPSPPRQRKGSGHNLRRIKTGVSIKDDSHAQATLLQDSQVLQELARSTSLANIKAQSLDSQPAATGTNELNSTAEQPLEASLLAFQSHPDDAHLLHTNTSSVDEDATMELDAAALLLGISRPKEAPAHGKTRALRTSAETQPNANYEELRNIQAALAAQNHETDHTIETDLSVLSQAMMSISAASKANDNAATREIHDPDPAQKPSFPDPLDIPNSAISNPAQRAVMTTSTLSTLSSANIKLDLSNVAKTERLPEKRTIKVDRLTTEDEFKYAAKQLTMDIATANDTFTGTLQAEVRSQIQDLASEVATEVVSNRVFDSEPQTIRGDMNQLAQQIAHRINTSELDQILGPSAREALSGLALELATELEREALEMAVINDAYASGDNGLPPEFDEDEDIIIDDLDDDHVALPDVEPDILTPSSRPVARKTVRELAPPCDFTDNPYNINDTDDDFDPRLVINAATSQGDSEPSIKLLSEPAIPTRPRPQRPADTIRESDPAFLAALENVKTEHPNLIDETPAHPPASDDAARPSAVTAGSLQGIKNISDNRIKTKHEPAPAAQTQHQPPTPSAPPHAPANPQNLHADPTPTQQGPPPFLQRMLPSKRMLMIISGVLTFIATVMATAVGLMMYFR